MKRTTIYLLPFVFLFFAFYACENVEDGYTVDYDEASAEFTVELLTSEIGSEGDSAIFSITINSDYNIKSILTILSESGGDGSGYIIDTTENEDPFIDHAYGTVQPGTKSLSIQYAYIFPSDTTDNTLTIRMIDEEGEAEVEYDLEGILDITSYDSVCLYTQTARLTDAFSTSNGNVYTDIADYSDETDYNLDIQEYFDIIFLVEDDTAMLTSPYDGYENAGLSVSLKTHYVRLTDYISADEFDDITNITLSEITEKYNVKKGAATISNIQVGDVIGFRTDLSSKNSYCYGMLRINAIHPTTVDYYDGTCYVLEIDVKTQQSN